jgi:cellulose biosynthesis protein BcsQ
MFKTLKEFEIFGQQYNKKINYSLLYTLYDARESVSQKYLREYLTKYDGKIFSSMIRRNTDVKNAIDQKKTIQRYNIHNRRRKSSS